MSRGARVSIAVLGIVLALGAVGCGDNGGNSDTNDSDTNESETTLTRDQAIEILVQQSYTQEAAECTIDNAKLQDVDVMDVFTRDQITEREAGVLAVVRDFCVGKFGTTGATGTPATSETSASG